MPRLECLLLLFSLLLASLSAIAYFYESIKSIEDFWNTTGTRACYYLTSIEPEKLLNSNCGIVVVEASETPQWLVEELREEGVLVLAYINAGYAENWRSYWARIAGKPWVHGETGYEGEYYVEYWRKEWKDIIIGEAESLIARGYMGVYLDNIDAGEILGEKGFPWTQGVNTTREMIRLVCSVHQAVEGETRAKIYVNIGGAVDMLYDNSLLRCIDGLLREELWSTYTGYNSTSPQDPEETIQALDALAYAKTRGKTVIVADPVPGEEEAKAFCMRAWSHGFIPVPQPAWLYDYSSPPPPEWCRTGRGG